MEEGKDAHDAVVGAQKEDLAQLLDVRDHVVVREHHAFWLASRNARKNDRGQIVEAGAPLAAGAILDAARRQESGGQRGAETFADFGLLRQVLQENRFYRRLDMRDAFQKSARGNDRL